MLIIKSIILAIVQGITEFFPVSSSAHLKLISFFFNDTDSLLFDLSCHLGTTLAAILFLRKEIIKVFEEKKACLFILAILPLFPAYFLLKKEIFFLSDILFLPFSLLCTSLILLIASYSNKKPSDDLSSKRKIKDVLLIGSMQALALIPGLSRSGFTIAGASLRGWKIEEAVKFSFLLSIPTILGGNFLEGYKFFKDRNINPNDTSIYLYLIGFLVAFIIGFLTIRYIFSIRSSKKLKPFGFYVLGLAIFCFIYLYIIR